MSQPWYRWTVIDIAYEENPSYSKTIITTDKTCNLKMYWKNKPPFRRHVNKWVKGVLLNCDIAYSFRKPNMTTSWELGDTLVHTFSPMPWPVCETHWFYLKGTRFDFPAVSKSPFFSHHHTEPQYGPPVTAYFYPDSGIGKTTVDGTIRCTSTTDTWEFIHRGPGTAAAPTAQTSYISITSYYGEGIYFAIYRAIFTFDTSAIPVGSLINWAQLRLWVNSKNNTLFTYPTWAVVPANPVSDNNLVLADYVRLGSEILSEEKEFYDISEGGWNDWVLNAAGIASIVPGGITRLGVREYSHDALNVEPYWHEYKTVNINVNFADKGIGYRPRLDVTYQPPL